MGRKKRVSCMCIRSVFEDTDTRCARSASAACVRACVYVREDPNPSSDLLYSIRTEGIRIRMGVYVLSV